MTAALAMKASHESASTVSATINMRFIVCVWRRTTSGTDKRGWVP